MDVGCEREGYGWLSPLYKNTASLPEQTGDACPQGFVIGGDNNGDFTVKIRLQPGAACRRAWEYALCIQHTRPFPF